MKPVQTLPAAFREAGTIDVSKNTSFLLILNLVGLVLMLAFGWLFFRAVITLSPDILSPGMFSFSPRDVLQSLKLIAAILLLTGLAVILHEAIHGLFFWIFTRSRPEFALRIHYAYAAAPGWYLPRGDFLVTTLAPLVIISLGGLACMPVIPPGWVLPVWYILTFNAGGAVGDLLVAAWLLIQPSSALVQDRGDVVTLYLPKP